MGMPSISGAGGVSASTADTPALNVITSAVRQIGAVAAVEIDAATQQPKPPRFPWQSRLSQQLESAARQRPAFASAPVLGDQVDRSV